MNLIGRKDEIAVLKHILHSRNPEFLALYGRRRVGKTFLIRQFFKDKKVIFFNVTGSKDGSRLEQLSHFVQQIGKVFYSSVSLVVPEQWDEAFRLLTQAINQQPKNKKIILFFDELPWMATPKSRILQSLDYYWNQHWSNDKRIKLIICGSSASWIIHKIINNRGGLHNRITQRIRLEPFTFVETHLFLKNQGINLKNQHVLLLYMVMGGIPYYLSKIKKGLSATQIIEKLAFTQEGILFNEFDNLFSSLFDDAESYIQLVSNIANRQYGIGKRELLKLVGKSAIGGTGLKKLEDLEEAGFIMSFMPYQHKRQGIYYRLIDEYVLFYLRWILPIRKTLQKKTSLIGGWQIKQKTPEWYAWQGYAFEAFCYKHIDLIRRALAITPDAIANSWRYVPRKGTNEQGAQIDLLFDRSDDAITLCEIKFTGEPFTLTKEYVEVLKCKMAVFKEQTRTKKQLFMALITANGVKSNYYTEDLIAKVVTLDDFFNH